VKKRGGSLACTKRRYCVLLPKAHREPGGPSRELEETGSLRCSWGPTPLALRWAARPSTSTATRGPGCLSVRRTAQAGRDKVAAAIAAAIGDLAAYGAMRSQWVAHCSGPVGPAKASALTQHCSRPSDRVDVNMLVRCASVFPVTLWFVVLCELYADMLLWLCFFMVVLHFQLPARCVMPSRGSTPVCVCVNEWLVH
jgi:hypothetical protein